VNAERQAVAGGAAVLSTSHLGPGTTTQLLVCTLAVASAMESTLHATEHAASTLAAAVRKLELQRGSSLRQGIGGSTTARVSQLASSGNRISPQKASDWGPYSISNAVQDPVFRRVADRPSLAGGGSSATSPESRQHHAVATPATNTRPTGDMLRPSQLSMTTRLSAPGASDLRGFRVRQKRGPLRGSATAAAAAAARVSSGLARATSVLELAAAEGGRTVSSSPGGLSPATHALCASRSLPVSLARRVCVLCVCMRPAHAGEVARLHFAMALTHSLSPSARAALHPKFRSSLFLCARAVSAGRPSLSPRGSALIGGGGAGGGGGGGGGGGRGDSRRSLQEGSLRVGRTHASSPSSPSLPPSPVAQASPRPARRSLGSPVPPPRTPPRTRSLGASTGAVSKTIAPLNSRERPHSTDKNAPRNRCGQAAAAGGGPRSPARSRVFKTSVRVHIITGRDDHITGS
jgi:hypothetical protein